MYEACFCWADGWKLSTIEMAKRKNKDKSHFSGADEPFASIVSKLEGPK
jgi:hypothetical protein